MSCGFSLYRFVVVAASSLSSSLFVLVSVFSSVAPAKAVVADYHHVGFVGFTVLLSLAVTKSY